MSKVAIVFGTDTGYTRKIAKLVAKKLGADIADKPVNINRLSLDQFLAYDALILGTPTYGEGVLPGTSTGIDAGSWAEFLPQLQGHDLSAKTIALYGFGDQLKYPTSYVSAMGDLYQALAEKGAKMIGSWPTQGYTFEHSSAVVDDVFVGLALDEKNQGALTQQRVEQWLEEVKPALLGS